MPSPDTSPDTCFVVSKKTGLDNWLVRAFIRPMGRFLPIRKSVILDPVVWGLAQENMLLRGFNNNFSAYVRDLISRDLVGLTTEQRLMLRDAAIKPQDGASNKKSG